MKSEAIDSEATQTTDFSLREFADLGEELVKYVGTLKLEKETKDQIAQYINEIQSALSKPMELNAGRLSKWFPGVNKVVLVKEEKLVLRKGKKETQISVLELKPDPYVAVVKEATSSVARLLAEEEVRRTEKIKSGLQASTRVMGGS